MNKIYTMKLHEIIKSDSEDVYSVTRVPGGWIYNMIVGYGGGIRPVFVPYNNEFKE